MFRLTGRMQCMCIRYWRRLLRAESRSLASATNLGTDPAPHRRLPTDRNVGRRCGGGWGCTDEAPGELGQPPRHLLHHAHVRQDHDGALAAHRGVVGEQDFGHCAWTICVYVDDVRMHERLCVDDMGVAERLYVNGVYVGE